MRETMRQHLTKMHATLGEHHEKMAEAETEKATAARALGETLENGEACESSAAACDKAAEAHTTLSDYHSKCMKDLTASMKAEEAEELAKRDRIRPDGIRGVIPSDVPRPILRTGQPGLVDKTDVPVEFEGFLRIES